MIPSRSSTLLGIAVVVGLLTALTPAFLAPVAVAALVQHPSPLPRSSPGMVHRALACRMETDRAVRWSGRLQPLLQGHVDVGRRRRGRSDTRPPRLPAGTSMAHGVRRRRGKTVLFGGDDAGGYPRRHVDLGRHGLDAAASRRPRRPPARRGDGLRRRARQDRAVRRLRAARRRRHVDVGRHRLDRSLARALAARRASRDGLRRRARRGRALRRHHGSALSATRGRGTARGRSARRRTRPRARCGHAMAYDAAHGQIVLFGGTTRGLLGDTWTWDGTDWTSAPCPPRPALEALGHGVRRRAGPSRCCSAASTEVTFGDTWTWDGADWTQRPGGSLQLDPPSGHAGDTVSVQGWGFAAGERVQNSIPGLGPRQDAPLQRPLERNGRGRLDGDDSGGGDPRQATGAGSRLAQRPGGDGQVHGHVRRGWVRGELNRRETMCQAVARVRRSRAAAPRARPSRPRWRRPPDGSPRRCRTSALSSSRST